MCLNSTAKSADSARAPNIVLILADDKGDVRLPVNPNAGNGNGQFYNEFNMRGRGGLRMAQADIVGIDGFAPPQPVVTPTGTDGKKALSDIKFEAYDVTGKLVQRSDALNRLKAGGLILLAGDNRFPDANYLQAFREDLLVIVSSELVFQPGQPNPFDRATLKPAAPAVAQPANPAVAPAQLLPAVGIAAPAVIKRVQIQVEK